MQDVIIGIDAGTSVIKSVAFDSKGQQLAVSSVPNVYSTLENGGVEQDMETTWLSTLATLKGLAEQIDNLKDRLSAISITGQGDGTWLIDESGNPVSRAWLWLDARAGQIAKEISESEIDLPRFTRTGTGINACQQGPQLLWLKRNTPEVLEKSVKAMHCKDWLYYKMTNQCVTDPSEGCFTFGDFRTRQYATEVIEALDLKDKRHLLPDILDGAVTNHPLIPGVADTVGLLAGTPVVLGYVDIIATALGAGLYDPETSAGCTIIGSTGVHMGMSRQVNDVILNSDRTGYTMPMPIPGVSAMIQTNMASTLNIDWLMDMVLDVVKLYKPDISRKSLINEINNWLEQSHAAGIIYHPYISEAGERGPFIDSKARASFIGLSTRHRFPDLIRSVVEGLAFAANDCYHAMGGVPQEVRVTGGAARSTAIRSIFKDVLGTAVRTVEREEAGAAGTAMIAAVSVGHYRSMDECVQEWVRPLLGERESHDSSSHATYQTAFNRYVGARKALAPIWQV